MSVLNPFLTNIRGFGGKRLSATSADERLAMVKRFGIPECESALKLPYVQKTVRVACERRLRQLNREAS